MRRVTPHCILTNSGWRFCKGLGELKSLFDFCFEPEGHSLAQAVGREMRAAIRLGRSDTLIRSVNEHLGILPHVGAHKNGKCSSVFSRGTFPV